MAMQCLARFPGINIFYDMLFDDTPPNKDSIREALNTIGLLSALTLTVALAIPTAVDYGEMMDTVARFNCSDVESIYKGVCTPYALKWNGQNIVNSLANGCARSQSLLTSCVGVVVMMLIVMETTGTEAHYSEHNRYQAWWKWNRIIFFWLCLSLILGCFLTFNTYAYLWMVKFPDFYKLEQADTPEGVVGSAWSTKSTSGYIDQLMLVINWGISVVCFAVSGMGLRALTADRDSSLAEKDVQM
jgi:hypothetical protein